MCAVAESESARVREKEYVHVTRERAQVRGFERAQMRGRESRLVIWRGREHVSVVYVL